MVESIFRYLTYMLAEAAASMILAGLGAWLATRRKAWVAYIGAVLLGIWLLFIFGTLTGPEQPTWDADDAATRAVVLGAVTLLVVFWVGYRQRRRQEA